MRLRVPLVVATIVLILPAPHAGGDIEPRIHDAPVRYEALVRERAAHAPLPVLVHFDDAAARDVALTRWPDARALAPLPALVLPGADRATLDALAHVPGVRFVEAADKPIAFAIASARTASRADLVTGDATRNIPPLTLSDGTPIDGRGIGIALIDTGIDPTHPDLAGRITGTYIATPHGILPAPDADPLSPHGTHMAGILAGSGALDARMVGVAPGARIHSIDVGPAATNLFVADALAWVLAHKDHVDPPIRIVVNAWGCATAPCRAWDPDQAHHRLATALAENGTIVVFPAGNERGNGFVSTVNPEATNPTPGILGVAEYSDDDIGTRNGCTSGSTARGAYDDPNTWPDVSAPGAWIWSPNGVHVGEDARVPGVERKAYNYFHGTSAAAAHLGGIAALALQAVPALTPRAFEYLVKDTASKLDCGLGYVQADATHPWGTTHPVAGHGLVDAHAVVTAAATVEIPSDEPVLEPPPQEWLVARGGVTPTRTLHLTPHGGLDEAAPAAGLPTPHHVQADVPLVFTSAPLDEGERFSAARVDLWWGTLRECVCARANVGRFGVTVDVLHDNGTATALGTADLGSWYVHPGLPTQRHLDLRFDEYVTQPNDRLRLTVGVLTPPGFPLLSTDFLLYTGARETASRIAIGIQAAPQNGDAVWCQVRQDCADVGGDRHVEGLHCDSVPMRVEWRGPPGSGIVLTCAGTTLACSIPVLATDGTCAAETLANPTQTGEKTATCRYHTLDGAPTGHGRCLGLIPREGGD